MNWVKEKFSEGGLIETNINENWKRSVKGLKKSSMRGLKEAYKTKNENVQRGAKTFNEGVKKKFNVGGFKTGK